MTRDLHTEGEGHPPHSPVVEVHPGHVPPFWDHSAIFFANLLSIFYGKKSKTDVLMQEVSSIRSYGGRLLPILNLLYRGGSNLLALDQLPEGHLQQYFRDTLGLGLPEVVVLPQDAYEGFGDGRAPSSDSAALLERLRSHPAERIDGFVTDSSLERIARSLDKETLNTAAGSSQCNDKLRLHRHLAATGLPVFDTLVEEGAEAILAAARELLGKGYKRAVVKSPIGASGIGMIRIDAAAAEKGDLPAFLEEEGPCLVQGWIEEGVGGFRVIGSPSVQIFIAPDAVHLYDITDQLLSDESVHQGNVAPPPYFGAYPGARDALVAQGIAAAHWLHAQGYKGTASVDFLLVTRGEALTAYICEINARVTGATYPAVLARHFLPSGAWLMRNLLFARPVPADAILAALAKTGRLWLPEGEQGVLPINLSPTGEGTICKGQFLCLADNTDACVALCDSLTHLLPVEARHDRD